MAMASGQWFLSQISLGFKQLARGLHVHDMLRDRSGWRASLQQQPSSE